MDSCSIELLLDQYIPNPEIPLYFVNTYTLLIATLLSAQCTDERVNLVTKKLFLIADSPEKMVLLSQKELAEMIYPCGIANVKAENILKLSGILIEQFKGEVPSSFDLLEMLPGVGHKTASVIMVQAFGVPAFPVDTHIFRLARRWGLSAGSTVEKVEKDLKAFFPIEKWGKVHLQMVLFGRKYCKAKGHDLKVCPVCSL